MNSNVMREIPIDLIKFTQNYRHTFKAKSLEELANSIRQHGIIEPLVVRARGDHYELIAGERRLKASRIAGLDTVPCIIREVGDAKVLELQLVENVQREPAPYFEEAMALRRLRDAPYNYDVQKIAETIGKSEPYVYMQLKLTTMCLTARHVCERGEISKSVAWLIARIKDENVQANAARALRREEKTKLVSDRFARKYLEALKNGEFTERAKSFAGMKSDGTARQPTKKFYTVEMSDYLKNWRNHLADFTPEQYAQWKIEIGGKTDFLVWARAVDKVMTGSESEGK